MLISVSCPACAHCRACKIRCDIGMESSSNGGHSGSCTACVSAGIDCRTQDSERTPAPPKARKKAPLDKVLSSSPNPDIRPSSGDPSPRQTDRRSADSADQEVFAMSRPSSSFQSQKFTIISVPFFRYLGPTANTPGHRMISVRNPLVNTTTHNSTGASNEAPQISGRPSQSAPDTRRLFEEGRSRYPEKEILLSLMDIFAEKLICHFPFLDIGMIRAEAESGKLPAAMANVIAALSARFSDSEKVFYGSRSTSGEPFLEMAKVLVVQLLSWPSIEVTQTLILIAWAEFGSARDSVAMDLGIHNESCLVEVHPASLRNRYRQTWWSCLFTDRINSWGIGRPVAIQEPSFDAHLPSVDQRELEEGGISIELIFPHLYYLIILRGRISELLNNSKLYASSEPQLWDDLDIAQAELTRFYHSLPPSLRFSIQTLRTAIQHGVSAPFLLLHLMFHSVISLIHRPSLLKEFTPSLPLPSRSLVDLSISSTQTIAHMLNVARSNDPSAFITNPFADLPILTTARALMREKDSLQARAGDSAHMYIEAIINPALHTCKECLTNMSLYWGGVGTVSSILSQQERGMTDFEIDGDYSVNRKYSPVDVELIRSWARQAIKSRTKETESMSTTTSKSGPPAEEQQKKGRHSPYTSGPSLPPTSAKLSAGTALDFPSIPQLAMPRTATPFMGNVRNAGTGPENALTEPVRLGNAAQERALKAAESSSQPSSIDSDEINNYNLFEFSGMLDFSADSGLILSEMEANLSSAGADGNGSGSNFNMNMQMGVDDDDIINRIIAPGMSFNFNNTEVPPTTEP